MTDSETTETQTSAFSDFCDVYKRAIYTNKTVHLIVDVTKVTE